MNMSSASLFTLLLCLPLIAATPTTNSDPASFDQYPNEQLQALAEKGNGDAAFALGNRFAAVNDQRSMPLSLKYYNIAAKAKNIPALEKLLQLNQNPANKVIDKNRQVLLLKQLAVLGSTKYQYQLRDYSPQNYWNTARVTLAKERIDSLTPTFLPQRVLVQLTDLNGDLATARRGKVLEKVPADIRIDFADVHDLKTKAGRFVEVAGFYDGRSYLKALMVMQPEPKYSYFGSIVPQAVEGSKEQNWIIQVVVKNLGTQPIKRLSLNVRCYQLQSPNDYSKELVLTELNPGATVVRTVDFSMYNFQYIANFSFPKLEVTQNGDCDW